MEPDDEHEDDVSSGPLLPPDDRLWRHPSELAVGNAARPASPAPSVGTAPSFGAAPSFGTAPWRFVEGRIWPVVLVSGVVGALLATAAAYTLGGGAHRV
ncbi:MAG TPA: hypothetical protein VMU14_23885, partial [Acidimicrobiales bacterium]|nr:hypothetical protein [Acidimicrobiales bacterium]